MTEHVVTRINDGYYVCDVCAAAGSERWAIMHQFPSATIVMEGPLTPGPGTESLQQAASEALGVSPRYGKKPW